MLKRVETSLKGEGRGMCRATMLLFSLGLPDSRNSERANLIWELARRTSFPSPWRIELYFCRDYLRRKSVRNSCLSMTRHGRMARLEATALSLSTIPLQAAIFLRNPWEERSLIMNFVLLFVGR